MKKIVTAVGEPFLNDKLSLEENIKVIGKDILYQEAVLEILEKNEIDYLIISDNIPGEKNIEELIEKIKQIKKEIKIIYLLNNKHKNIEDLLQEKNINYIYFEKMKNIELLYLEIIEKITNKNKQEKFEEKKEMPKKYLFKSDKKEIKEVIAIYGYNGVGKTTTSLIWSKIIGQKINKEILMIDVNVLNEDSYYLFKKEKNKLINKNKTKEISRYKKINKNKKVFLSNKSNNNFFYLNVEKTIKKSIIKINKNIDLFYNFELIFNKQIFLRKKDRKILFAKVLKELKKIYHIIIIDSSLQDELNLNKEIFKQSTKIVVLFEPNLLGIKREKEILRKCISEYKIPKQSLHIVVNKADKFSIDRGILKECFFGFRFYGEINYNKNYTKLINQNYKEIFLNKKIINENNKIIKKIIKIKK